MLNGEEYHWDVYNKSGEESHKIYFKGYNTSPCFYLKSGKNRYRIYCDNDDIKMFPITEAHWIDEYLKDYCSCKSSTASCWAIALGYTSRPENYPFNEI